MSAALLVPLSAPEAADVARFGPKGANLAKLGHGGLPTPGGYCLSADAYRLQIKALGLEASARGAFATDDGAQARRYALNMKIALMDEPITPEILDPLLEVWNDIKAKHGLPIVVRSSALVEDRFGSSFAGQFESFLDLEDETDFQTAIRACWAAMWSTRALRYMATHNLDPADTAMALIIQPLIPALAAGGGLSQTVDGGMLINATWGLGSSIAQGEVTPDRYLLSRDAVLTEAAVGPKYHAVGCTHRKFTPPKKSDVPKRCLNDAQVAQLGGMLRRAEEIMGLPVEIEWAMDDDGIKMLQARPLHVGTQEKVPDEIWRNHPRLRGQPAGVGWGTGRARVVNCECELAHVAPGDVLITKSAGPALSRILIHVSAVVSELGGSTSHLASLARERGIPMVLGVADATTTIPDGAQVAVDGVAGIVRWMA
ncbi:MAG TPA: PEP/pyruvate-binding domain-containing protein [Burkholderiales bacterium]|nr:PEP/pyruvate-binding domain-containing protein [Burkholderiales bacterium]